MYYIMICILQNAHSPNYCSWLAVCVNYNANFYCKIALISVLGAQPAGDVIHKPGGRLPLLSARPAVTLATLMRADTSFAAW